MSWGRILSRVAKKSKSGYNVNLVQNLHNTRVSSSATAYRTGHHAMGNARVKQNAALTPIQDVREIVPRQSAKRAKSIQEMNKEEFAKYIEHSKDPYYERIRQEADLASMYDELTLKPQFRKQGGSEALKQKHPGLYASTKEYRRGEDIDTMRRVAGTLAKKGPITAEVVQARPELGIYSHFKGGSVSEGWLHFNIGKRTGLRPPGGTPKGYGALRGTDKFSHDDIMQFTKKLDETGFVGNVKVPTTESRIAFGYDNLVMHGQTDASIENALGVAKSFFGDRLSHISIGLDPSGTSANRALAEHLLHARTTQL